MSLLKIGEIKNLNNHRIKLGEVYTGLPSYVYSNTIDTDAYNDITSNKSWMYEGRFKYDYLFCRNQIMMWTPNYVNKEGGIGWSGLTLEEKQIAAKNFAVGPTERSEVYSNDELQEYWNEFVDKSQDCRSSRWKLGKGYISYVLNPSDSLHVAELTNNLSNSYIVYGIESLADDGVVGLFDWVEGTGPYSGGTGFSGQSYWTQEHQDKLSSILRKGYK